MTVQTVVSQFCGGIDQFGFSFLQAQIQRLFLQSLLFQFIIDMFQFQHRVFDAQVLGFVLSPSNTQLQGVLRGLFPTFGCIQRVYQLIIRLHREIGLPETVEQFVSNCHIGQSVCW